MFLAELGDKSMLLAIALAARYRAGAVLGGIAIGATASMGLASLAGAALGAALPTQALTVGGGALFIVFGLWTIRQADDAGESADLGNSSVVLGTTFAFVVAEFGDKTMIATATLASTGSAWATWIGASLGTVLACALAVTVTSWAGAHLPSKTVRTGAALAFFAFGAVMIITGLRY